MSIVYSSRIDNFSQHNSSFDYGVLRVCYVGKNRNGSSISKQVFERCMPSIFNCPVVCRYERETDSIGEHDVEVIKQADGTIKMVEITDPVGVVPESSRIWWEEVEEQDGSVHEYLCVDVLLWKRQEAYQKIKDDGITDESMEIRIKEGHMEDGVYVIDDFEFTAFCLLGSAPPCYESASLLLFAKESFSKQLNQMMMEFKASFAQAQSPASAEVAIKEGGENNLNEKRDLMNKYGFSEEDLSFKLDDFSVEELTAKFDEMKASNESAAFALAEQFRGELIDALCAETIETCFGDIPRFMYVDHDADCTEVYCYDYCDWKLYGMTYSMNGDNVVIDFDSTKRKKFSIVDFDEGEQNQAFAKVFSLLAEKYEANNAEWDNKYSASEGRIVSLESENEELKAFKADVESAVANQERESVFEQFADIATEPAFVELKDACGSYSVADLEEKCFAIRGRKQSAKFSKDPVKVPKLPVNPVAAPAASEPYGGVFEEFGITISE